MSPAVADALTGRCRARSLPGEERKPAPPGRRRWMRGPGCGGVSHYARATISAALESGERIYCPAFARDYRGFAPGRALLRVARSRREVGFDDRAVSRRAQLQRLPAVPPRASSHGSPAGCAQLTPVCAQLALRPGYCPVLITRLPVGCAQLTPAWAQLRPRPG